MRSTSSLLRVLILVTASFTGSLVTSYGLESSKADAFVAEATEIISVVRIGVSLVEYIYKVFSHIWKDSGAADAAQRSQETSKKLLEEYQVLNRALDRLDAGHQSVQAAVSQMHRDLPLTIRRELKLDHVDEIIRSIYSSYDTFKLYQENKNSIEEHTLQDFALSATRKT